MKTIIITLLCSAIVLCAQTTEPMPFTFNFGTPWGTTTFSNYAPKQTSIIRGWQWDGTDTLYDRYMHANFYHTHMGIFADRQRPKKFEVLLPENYWVYEIYFEGNNKCLRYDPEVQYPSSVWGWSTMPFIHLPLDTSGASLGFAYRHSYATMFDTSVASTNYKRLRIMPIVKQTTPIKVLSDIKPNNLLTNYTNGHTAQDSSKDTFLDAYKYPEYLKREIGDSLWYCSINLRRLKVTGYIPSDTTSDTCLSVKVRYWFTRVQNGFKVIDSSYIVFDSIPTGTYKQSKYGWVEQGLMKTSGADSQKIVYPIQKRQLPLFATPQDPSPDVTLSAYFALGNGSGNKPLKTMNERYASLLDKIDSIDIEVYYHGGIESGLGVDYIKLEDIGNRRLVRGERDSAIQALVQTMITKQRVSLPEHRIFRFGFTESEEGNTWTQRYINRLLDGCMAGSTNSTLWKHRVYAEKSKDRWIFPTSGVWQTHTLSVPYVGSIDTCEDCRSIFDSTKFNCNSNVLAMGLKGGYTRFTSAQDTTQPDTLHSVYEVSDMPIAERNFVAQTTRLDSAMSKLGGAVSYQSNIDAALVGEYRDHGFAMYYSETPFWTQYMYHTMMQLKSLERKSTLQQLSHLFTSPSTGETTRQNLWMDIIRGCKGFVVDNGGWNSSEQRVLLNWDSLITKDKTLKQSLQFGPRAGNTLSNMRLSGTDFLQLQNDSSGYVKWIDTIRTPRILGVPKDRMYIGARSTREELRKVFTFLDENSNELMRLRLVAWLGKGFRTWNTGDTTKAKSVLSFNRDKIKIRPINRVSSQNIPFYENNDSTYFDVTLLKDSSDANSKLDSVFYVGVMNRRTDPMRHMNRALNPIDTAMRMVFLATQEYQDSLQSPDASRRDFWKSHEWTQLGAREITIPFAYRHPDGKPRLLRVQELGGSLDTILWANAPLALNYLPGEGKILRCQVLPAWESTTEGNLANSNQRNIICTPFFDSGRETDSIRYHLTYFKDDTVTGGSSVFYKRSTLIHKSRNFSYVDVEWEAQEYALNREPAWIPMDNDSGQIAICAYPVITSTIEYPNGVPTTQIHIAYCGLAEPLSRMIYEMENVFYDQPFLQVGSPWVVDTTAPQTRPQSFNDLVYLSEFGAPALNANPSGNYYAWRGTNGKLRVWHKAATSRQFTTVPHEVCWLTNTLSANCRYPAFNTYSLAVDAALVWQESVPESQLNMIGYTSISNDGYGTVSHGLYSPIYNGTTNSDTTVLRLDNPLGKMESNAYPSIHRGIEPYTVQMLYPVTFSINYKDVVSWTTTIDQYQNTYATQIWSNPPMTMPFGSFTQRSSVTCFWSKYYNVHSSTLSQGISRASHTIPEENVSDSAWVMDFSATPKPPSIGNNPPTDNQLWQVTRNSLGGYLGTEFEISEYNTTFYPWVQKLSDGLSPELSASSLFDDSYPFYRNRRVLNPSDEPSLIVSSKEAMYKSSGAKKYRDVTRYVGFHHRKEQGYLSTLFSLTDSSNINFIMPRQDSNNPSLRMQDTVFSSWFKVGTIQDIAVSSLGSLPPSVRVYVQRKNNKNQIVDVPVKRGALEVKQKNVFRLRRGSNQEYRFCLVNTLANSEVQFVEAFELEPLLSEEQGFSKDGVQEITEVSLQDRDVSLQQGISVYPNPSQKGVYVDCVVDEREVQSTATFTVYSYTGERVFSVVKNTFQTYIDISELPNGVYTIQCEYMTRDFGKQTSSTMFVVSK